MAVPKGQIQTWVRWQAVLHHYSNTCYYRFRLPVNLAQRGASGPQKTFVPTKFLISIPVGIMDRGKRGERGKKLARFRESSQITQTVFFPVAVYHAAANIISDMIAGNFCALQLLRSQKLTPLRAREIIGAHM